MRMMAIGLCGFVLALLGLAGSAGACPNYPQDSYWRPCPDTRNYDPPQPRPCPDCGRYPAYPEPRPCVKCVRPAYPEPRPCPDCGRYPAYPEPRPCGGCGDDRPYPAVEPYPDTPRCTQRVPKADPEFSGRFATVRDGYLAVIGARGKEICHFFRGDTIFVPNYSCRRDVCSVPVRQYSFPVEISTSSIDLYD